MTTLHCLGLPRIGPNRELKFALEKYWKGDLTAEQLQSVAKNLRLLNWQAQIDNGLDFVQVGDFSFYDLVADHIQWLGCTPKRFTNQPDTQPEQLDHYFSMVRGTHTFALEMTKWFNTNYHYMVPEFDSETTFSCEADALLEQVAEARSLGKPVKVQLIGPLTFLFLGKSKDASLNRLDLLDSLLPVYAELLDRLKNEGAEWVQLDEPALSLDLPVQWQSAFERAYSLLQSRGPKKLLATYFGTSNGQTALLCRLPVDGIHLDCVEAAQDLPVVLDWLPNYRVLSLGLVNGRNIWKTDLDQALKLAQLANESGWTDKLWIAPSCSLLHVPYSFEREDKLKPEVKNWLAGVSEKLEEIRCLGLLLGQSGHRSWAETFSAHQREALQARKASQLTSNPAVRNRLNSLPADADKRTRPFADRQTIQQAQFKLPAFPTTSIGSFPQTADIRSLRKQWRKGEVSTAHYESAVKKHIAQAISFQEEVGLDVLVHGEAERTDMVEYFGELLEGFDFTQNGWVQSYGSRCVKPPILFGDVSRPRPMTVEVSKFAQSLTDRPVKGMLTGPVTILQWSFVRDDQAREETAMQIALAIRDEVQDLEANGIRMIQIDEPAFREGLPLRKSQWAHYLRWAAKAFRVSANGVEDATQIHTHMCYSEFNDILPSIASMDADVITIETSRSDMELLTGFGEFAYPNEIGPGVYDIHSPRIPTVEQMQRLLEKASKVIPARNLWVNPDCGLKTRNWPETEAALRNMLEAARNLREIKKAA